jgi:ATP-dependent DNA helicase RecG
MKENGSPPTEFEFDEDHSYFMVRLPVHPAAKEVSLPVGEQVTGNAAGQPESQPESMELRVLRLLQSDQLGKGELSAGLGQKEISGQLNKVVRILLNDESIEMTIPGKPSSRLQKYRLTEKGRNNLKQQFGKQ